MSSGYHVKLADANDFITPGLACVNPVFAAPAPPAEPLSRPALQLSFGDEPLPLRPAVKKAQVSLSDCLACSGCVTSAETVLLQQQSAEKFVSALAAIREHSSPFRVAVVTISAQARASLAARFGLPARDVHLRMAGVLRTKLGVAYVLDASNLAHDISLLEAATEFVARYRDRKAGCLPMLTSACPGWVCYAEKSHEFVLKHLSTAKSAQQVAGVIVKRLVAARLGLSPAHVYHATVMPCPDKKLEAARLDFAADDATDVDCVLTTTELCDVVMHAVSTAALGPTTTLEQPTATLDEAVHALGVTDLDPSGGIEPMGELGFSGEEAASGGSGGYLAYVFRYAAFELFGAVVPPGPLPFRTGRNADTWSLELQLDGRVELRFTAAYGFRNVQDVVRKMKRGACAFDFVEIMACPMGCANGGGQLPGDAHNVRKVLDAVTYRAPLSNPSLAMFYREFVRAVPYSDEARKLLHTEFHAVRKPDTDEAIAAAEW
jgi:iron only hydrogenase large subunit-like protein